MASLGCGSYPAHPDEVLKDELETRGISQRKSADSIGTGYSVLNGILNSHHSLGTTTALMFEVALGVPAESLMKLRLKYSMQATRADKALANKLKEIARAAALL